jgi:hypothetical protein
MKKPKLSINFGEGGFQGWLIRHVEKMVLGVVILSALWLLWGGTTLPGLPDNQTPDKLLTAAKTKRTAIATDRWTQDFLPERKVPTGAVRTLENHFKNPVDPYNYPTPVPLKKRLIRPLTPRRDPKIPAPLAVRVVPIEGAVAYQMYEGDVDPFDQIAEEEADEKKPPRRPPPPKRQKGAPGGMMPGGMMPGGMMPGGMIPGGTEEGGKGRRTRGTKGAAGAGGMMPGGMMPGGMMPGGMIPGGDEAPGGMMPGMDGGMGGGMMPGLAGGARRANDNAIEFQAPLNSLAKTRRGIVFSAVVPHEKLVEEFQSALADSLDYDASRDTPAYLTFFVQRVDVTDDPSVDPATLPAERWQDISTLKALDEAVEWAGTPQEIVDPIYLVPVAANAARNARIGLTHPLPPFIHRDLWDVLTHPDVPLATATVAPVQQPSRRRPERSTEEGDEVPGVPGAGSRAAGGMMPGGMMPGGMMPGGMMPGGMMPGGMMPGDAGGLAGGESGYDVGSAAPGGMMPGGMMPGGMMPGGMMPGGMMPGGMMPGGMMPGGMGGMPGSAFMGKMAKYKLIRFTDFTVEAGRKYRYRAKVVVNDPNNPSSPHVAPNPASLADDVRKRLATEEAAGTLRTYRASDEWSVPSEVVSLPLPGKYLAGEVTPDNSQEIIPNTARVPGSRETSAKLVAVVHDSKFAVDVPVEKSVTRGTTLNLVEDVEVPHPIYGDLRKLKEYRFYTDALVADIWGGEKLPLIDRTQNALSAPGEVLVVDAEGNLHVCSETDDAEEYRRYLPEKKEEKSASGQFDGGMVPGGFDDVGGVPLPGAEGDAGGGVPVPGGGGRRKR